MTTKPPTARRYPCLEAFLSFVTDTVFVPCKPFQESIVFDGKAGGAYPSKTPFRKARVGSWPCSETLD